MGGRPEETRLVLGPACSHGPCWAALPPPTATLDPAALAPAHPPPQAISTSWRALPHRAAFVLGKLPLLGGGGEHSTQSLCPLSQRDCLPQLILELPPAGSPLPF